MLVQEYCPKGDLYDMVTRGLLRPEMREGAFMGVVCYFLYIVSASTLISIFILFQARGVQYLHGLGIVHGDIKPENILLDLYDIPKLCDFGMSVMEGEVTQGFGTKPYMAPEIVVSQVRDNIRS